MPTLNANTLVDTGGGNKGVTFFRKIYLSLVSLKICPDKSLDIIKRNPKGRTREWKQSKWLIGVNGGNYWKKNVNQQYVR